MVGQATEQNGNKVVLDDAGILPFDTALLQVVPPLRFAVVEEGVYRGAYPTLRNFPFLSSLGLRSIVSLIPEGPTYDLRCFAASEGITIRYIHVERYKGEAQLLPTDMSEVLQLLINAEQHPLYIHCLDGRHAVGLAIMGLRKLQQWDVNCSLLEYQRFTHSVQDEVAFIADYSGPVTVPKQIPSWLWKGAWCDVSGKPKRLHVGIRLKFPPLLPGTASIDSRSVSLLGGSTGASGTTRPSRGVRGEVTPDSAAEVAQMAMIHSAVPIHTVPVTTGVSTEMGAAYVDLTSILPVQPVGPMGGGQHAPYAIQMERPFTADVRFLSLRASAETVSGSSPPRWQLSESWDPLSYHGNAIHSTGSATGGFLSNNTATTSELSGISRPTTQRGTPLFSGGTGLDADEDTNSSHFSQHPPLYGMIGASHFRFIEGSVSPVSSAKCSSQSRRHLHFVVADAAENGPSTDTGGGSKKIRRRKSV